MADILKLLFGSGNESLLPITHKLEWCDINDSVVESLEVNKLSDATAFSPSVKINVILSGHLVQKEGLSVVTKMHVSEKFAYDTEQQIAIITLCPIVSIKPGKNDYMNASFKVTCELHISTWKWGKNKILITAGEYVKEITAYQIK